MFNDNDIQQQLKIKKSLDEKNLLNPGKVYPILRKCAEEGRVHVHRGEEKFPDLPRFWLYIKADWWAGSFCSGKRSLK